jgi:hypothetical protein
MERGLGSHRLRAVIIDCNRNSSANKSNHPIHKPLLLVTEPQTRANIKIDLKEIEWGGMDWIDLVQDRDQWRGLVNTVTNLRVPQNVGKFLSNCTTGGFSRRAQLHGVSLMSGGLAERSLAVMSIERIRTISDFRDAFRFSIHISLP